MTTKLSALERPGPTGLPVTGILLLLWIALLLGSFALPPIGSSLVYQLKFAVPVGLLGWLVLALPRDHGEQIRGPINLLVIAFYFWSLAGIVSLFGAPYPLSGMALLLTYAVFFLLAVFVLPGYFSRLRDRDGLTTFTTLFFAGVTITVFCFMVAAHGQPFEEVNHEGRIRYAAYFSHPNFLGYFAFLISALAIRVYGQTNRKHILIFSCIAAFIAYLADSRTALAMIVLLPLLIFISANLFSPSLSTRRFSNHLFAVGAFLCLASLWLSLALGWVQLPTLTSLDELLSGRIALWGESLSEVANADFWLGQGLGREDFGSISVDSFYVSSLIQTGVLGLTCLVIFLATALWMIRPRISTPDASAAMAEVFPFCLLATLIVYALAENVLFSLGNPLAVYVWCEVGFRIRQLAMRNSPTDEAATEEDSSFVYSIPLVGLEFDFEGKS